jgi:hypothetical protein
MLCAGTFQHDQPRGRARSRPVGSHRQRGVTVAVLDSGMFAAHPESEWIVAPRSARLSIRARGLL